MPTISLKERWVWCLGAFLIMWSKIKSIQKKFIPPFLLAFLLFFYVVLQSPGLTGGDAGDLVTTATFKGVAHPPGYPLYTLLGWFLTKLPIGPTVAYRVGFLSSIPAAFSVLVVFLIAKKISKNFLISLISSLSLAFNYLFWLQAEVQETFALHLLFLFLTLYLILLWLKRPRRSIFYLIALITGLEFSHHHTYILIFPALIYLFFFNPKTKIKSKFFNKKFFLLTLVSFSFGVLFYLYAPWAAVSRSPINWLFTGDLKGLIRLIFRADYGTLATAKNLTFSFRRGVLALFGFAFFFYHEFTPLGVVLVLLGAFTLYKRQKVLFRFSFLWFIFAGVFFQFYAGFPLANWFSLATAERFYLLPYPIFFLWFIFGLVLIEEKVGNFFGQRNPVVFLLLSLFLLYPLFLLMVNFPKNDFRNFYGYDQFAKEFLDSCPNDSVVMTSSDLEFFSMIYTHYVNDFRPDLRLINIYNPKLAVFYLDEFSQFKPFFQKGRPASNDFWLAFMAYLVENKLTVCTTEVIKIDESYSSFPRGLVNLYVKDLEKIDYEQIFQENVRLWENYQVRTVLGNNSALEAFFNQGLISFYANRAFDISKFFAEGGEYGKAEFWLEQVQKFEPDSDRLIRMRLIVKIKQGQCDLAKEEIEKDRLVSETAKSWPLIEAIYEKECLGQEEKYKQILDKLKTGVGLDQLDSSDVPELD